MMADATPDVPAPTEDPTTHARVLALLTAHGASYTTLTHPPTRTSEESAAVRGVPLATGAKAMLVKAAQAHGQYALLVMSAARTADLKLVRGLLGVTRLSLASVEDVRAVTGCIPGAVPPFGSLFPGVRTYMDASLTAQGPVINFNAGLRGASVLGLSVADYVRIEQPVAADFAAPPPPAERDGAAT
jgi:Ala-tRNA(Pro) deacylase